MPLFRPSRSDSFIVNYLKTLAQTFVMWSVFLVLCPLLIIYVEDLIGWRMGWSGDLLWVKHLIIGVGISSLIMASSLGLLSAWSMVKWGKGTPLPMDCAKHLVVRGLYQYVRNPMALGGILQGISIGIIYQSWSVIVWSLMGAVVWHVMVRPAEERDLLQRFGDEYERYRRQVPLWRFRISTYQPSLDFESVE